MIGIILVAASSHFSIRICRAGIDKTGDMLDSAQAGHMFDELYVEVTLNPDRVDAA
jgi:hypothetical protein